MSKIYTDKWIDKTGVTRYFQDADATEKLSGIEEGAQENTIESVSVNGDPLTPDENKNVNIDIDVQVPVKGVSVNDTPVTPDEDGIVELTIPTGTAANKDFTGYVRENDTKVVTSGGVYDYINNLNFEGHDIANEDDIVYAQRSKLRFMGATITDDAVNDETVVTIRPGSAEVDSMQIVQDVLDTIKYRNNVNPNGELLVDNTDVINYDGANVYSYGELISYEPQED